jgi:hypothetical protein
MKATSMLTSWSSVFGAVLLLLVHVYVLARAGADFWLGLRTDPEVLVFVIVVEVGTVLVLLSVVVNGAAALMGKKV